MKATVRFANPIELYRYLKDVWASDTASPAAGWSFANPSRNHCSVTALVVQDHFGGEILTTQTSGGTHFYNSIDGMRWDLTIGQFAEPIAWEDRPSTREAALADTTIEKYRLVVERLLHTVCR